MKTTNRIVLAVLMLVVFAGMAMAQVTNVVVPVPGGTAQVLPQTVSEFWVLVIGGLTPLIVGGIYKLAPKIPKLIVPCSTPFVGILLGLLINWLAKQHFTWVDMGQAGGLAVFFYEVWDKAVTQVAKRFAVSDSAKPVVP